MKSPKYYHVDCGFFPTQIKLCFSNKDYQDILKDYGVELKATALDIGIAETHLIPVGTTTGGIIVMAFDLDACGDDPIEMAGYIGHEVVHCVAHVFDLVGEDVENIGRETNAYLTQHLIKQITKGINLENARKRDRKVSKQKDKRSQRAVIQVDKHSDGSARQDSNTSQSVTSSGVENGYGGSIGETKTGFQGARGAWAESEHYPEQK
jgi:predicted Zn-dependent protease with MMP-like domain